MLNLMTAEELASLTELTEKVEVPGRKVHGGSKSRVGHNEKKRQKRKTRAKLAKKSRMRNRRK